MGFHIDHHIFAARVPPDCFREHGVGLAHRSVPKKELELAALVVAQRLQPLLGSLGHRDHCLRKSFKVQSFKVLAARNAYYRPVLKL